MDLQKLYQSMDVSHLSVDEVEHELYIRKVAYGEKELDSAKRRRLKEKMKEERATDSFTVTNTWRKLFDEISLIKSKLHVIQDLLEGPRTPSHLKIKLKTKLIHYRVRIYLATKALGAHKFSSDLTNLAKRANKLFVTHFPEIAVEVSPKSSMLEDNISKALDEVRNEIEVLNESVSGTDLGNELLGGESEKALKIREEIESTEKRRTEALDALDELEKVGNLENASEMMKTLKNFVSQSAEEQIRMREERIREEERRMKEMEENMIRKKRLEQLLNDLTEKLKITESNAKADDKGKSDELKPGKSGKTELTESDASWHVSSAESSESYVSERKLKKKGKKEKKRRSGKGKSGKSKHKKKAKRNRKHSSSSQSSDSELTYDSDSSSTTSESSSSSSSDSSSESDSDRRKHRKYKKSRGKQRHLKRIPVAEWKLKYEGKDQGRKLCEFLKEVKMRKEAEDISSKDLFRSAIHLFSGRAKDWFMEGYENRDFRNWRGLKRELKREFLPPDLNFQIEAQASGRRQAKGEKFADYFHDMQKLFQAMTKPISERHKFSIVWRNMRFDYKNALTGANIKNLTKLKKYGRIVDENNCNLFQKSIEGPVRPKQHSISEITTSQFQKQKNNNSSGHNTKIFTKSKPKQENNEKIQRSEEPKGGSEKGVEKPSNMAREMEGTAAGTLQVLVDQYKRPPLGTCYNCRNTGHHYTECSNKRGSFCRVCGFQDVFTSKCPHCQKNGLISA